MNQSIRLEVPSEPINITPINPLISKCQIKVCYVGEQPNRNRSIITKEVATKMANSLPGSPIVGFYDEEAKDFESHNRELVVEDGKLKFKDMTRPYGFVDLGAKCWFQKFLDNGVEHEYLMTEGYLWTGQYPECKRVIDQGNNQSMELDEHLTQAVWTKSNNGKPQFFIINETVISKLCILGDDYEPCFEGANITGVQFSLDDSFNNQIYSMMKEVSDYINKGGELMENTEEVVLNENENTEPVIAAEDIDFKKKDDEEEKDKEPEENKESENSESDEDKDEEKPAEEEDKKKKKYNLDEIEEYVALQAQFANLQAELEALKTSYAALESSTSATINSLTEFKNQTERKEKEEMIKSFFMLSDEDKKEVVDNIDKYSLDDIEAKLSVICVRNKVSFNLDDDTDDSEPVTFNLDDQGSDLDLTPAWVKAVLDTEKTLNK